MDICTKDNNVHLTIEHTRNVDSTKIVITEMLNDEKMEVQQLLKEYNKEVQGSNEEKIKKYGEMCTELNGLVEKKKVEVQNMKNGSLSFLETQYEKDFILETKELHVDVLSTCESQLRKKLDKLISSRPPKLPTLPILPEKDNKKSLSDINPAEIPFFHFTAITVQPKTFKIKEKAMSEQRAAEMKSYEVAKSQTKSSGHSKSIGGKTKKEEVVKDKDKDFVFVVNKIEILKHWSKKTKYRVLFDSIQDGNGSNNKLHDKVIKKSGLFFISFDESNNIYGGYVNAVVNKEETYIKDPKSFVFTLKNKGKTKPIKYDIKKGEEQNAFYLCSNDNVLYQFGKSLTDEWDPADIYVCRVGCNKSFCNPNCFGYKKNKIKLGTKCYPYRFTVKRIIILHMK